jgi:hypothetical protein
MVMCLMMCVSPVQGYFYNPWTRFRPSTQHRLLSSMSRFHHYSAMHSGS